MGLPSGKPSAIEVERAEGIYFYDTGAKRYTDLVSGVAVSNVGHRHPAVLKAVEEQLGKYMHLMVYGEYIQSPQVRLAYKLQEQLPDALDAVYFVNSGSEAIEGALKLAKRHSGRPEIVAFKDAYHGGTAGALSILGNERLKRSFRPLLPEVRFLEFNNTRMLQQISEKTAAVVLECIQAEAGIILPGQAFLHQLQQTCKETGSLLIVDDIQMGFGRTGRLFSFEHYGIVPDILCVAKGMGGGMPAGAFISSRNIMDELRFNPELGHITTFGGHPVSCAAALANLDVILSEKLVENAEKRGRQFEESLHSHPAVKEIRRKGLMMAVELEDEAATGRLVELFFEHGLVTDRFLFRPSAFRIAPPLIISREQVTETAETILNCLDKL
ncbi:MAG: aspartate aminotransferase family protein [Bacteroidales bacterium]|jgi:acetylornithine/succinyldiaminopimelate/putrescine aminotransferase|nr:aspartate aminotransferase family protein [Bacteroidales bacterium]